MWSAHVITWLMRDECFRKAAVKESELFELRDTWEFTRFISYIHISYKIKVSWQFLSNKMIVTEYVPLFLHCFNFDIYLHKQNQKTSWFIPAWGDFFCAHADFYVTAGFIKGFPVDFPHSSAQAWKQTSRFP